jgi:hypothetical protein
MIKRYVKVPASVDGFHFVAPFMCHRIPSIDDTVLHCLWPKCQCENVTPVLEFIQHGFWADEHLLIVMCQRCNSASGYIYKASDPDEVKFGLQPSEPIKTKG